MNHRRQLILAAGLSPLVTPHAGLAQPAPRMRRIGHLSLSKRDNELAQTGRTMIRESLRRAGWEEGRNLVIERRYAEGEVARLDALAAELVRLEVEVIVASLNTAIGAAKRATSTVPIVMLGALIPVELGFVQSLARPGGNVSGTVVQGPELVAKSLEILKELAPGRTRVAILGNPTNPGSKIIMAETARAASVLGMTIQSFEPIFLSYPVPNAVSPRFGLGAQASIRSTM